MRTWTEDRGRPRFVIDKIWQMFQSNDTKTLNLKNYFEEVLDMACGEACRQELGPVSVAWRKTSSRPTGCVNSTPTDTARTKLHSMITFHPANTRGSRAGRLRIAHRCVLKQLSSTCHVSLLAAPDTDHKHKFSLIYLTYLSDDLPNTHTRPSVHDPYLPCDVPRQSGGSTQIPSLTESDHFSRDCPSDKQDNSWTDGGAWKIQKGSKAGKDAGMWGVAVSRYHAMSTPRRGVGSDLAILGENPRSE